MQKCRCGGKPILKGKVDKTVGKAEYHMSIKCVDCGSNIDCCVTTNDGTVIFPVGKLEGLAASIKKMWNAMCTEEEDDDEQSQK